MVSTRKTNNTEAPRGSPPPQPTFELNQEQLSQIIAVAMQKAMENRLSQHENRDNQEEDGDHCENNEIPHGEEEEEESRVPRQKRNEKKGDSQEVSKTSTMAEDLKKLMKKVRRLEGHVGSSMGEKPAKGCPFSEEVMHEPLPPHYKSAKIRDYDGSTDPEDHLVRFENIAMLHCHEDKIKCKAFLTTLVDSAQKWFNRLQPGSICSFDEFKDAFLHHFSSSKKYKKTAFSLFELRQSGDESLRSYIRRFNRAALEVPSCASETKSTAFTQGLREGDFFRSLVKKLPKDFEDLLSRAEKYINMEEAEKQKRESLRKEKRERVDRVGGKVPGKNTLGQLSRYTPLKISRDA